MVLFSFEFITDYFPLHLSFVVNYMDQSQDVLEGFGINLLAKNNELGLLAAVAGVDQTNKTLIFVFIKFIK